MANSKANIYPIQLQGAELNLNKFDAEIKQYSGFNKNNSPFVGGCLSNLFTKTEENTTGSSDSVYVDDNGDVYTVRDSRLMKNGEVIPGFLFNSFVDIKLEDYPENMFSYSINGDIETFFYYKDIESNQYDAVINICKRYYSTKEVIENGTIHYIPSKENCIYLRSYVNEIESGAIFIIYKDIYYNYQTDAYYIKITVDRIINNTYGGSYSAEYNVNKADFINCPAGFNSYSSDTVIVIPNIINENNAIFYKSGVFSQQPVSVVNNSLEGVIASDNVGDYVYIDFNAYLIRGSISGSTPKKVILKAFSILKNTNSDIYLDISSNEVVTQNLAGSLQFKIGIYEDKYLFSDTGVFYAIKTNDNKNFWGICGGSDKATMNVTLHNVNNDVVPVYEMGCRAGKITLGNNGYISGISTNMGEILLSQWNDVNSDYIFTDTNGDEFILFRSETNKKFYRVSFNQQGKIKEINGMLVINANGLNNCYRLSDGKILTFAPAWNNRALLDNCYTLSQAATDNTKYMASCINEYNLKENASIVINPIPVLDDILAIRNNVKFYEIDVYELEKDYNSLLVNYYTGDSSEILYRASSDFEQDILVINNNLKGLSFPANTDNNIMYSPSIFSEFTQFGNDVFIKEGANAYQLIKEGSESVMSYYLGTLIENLEDIFILQGQYYAIIDKQIFNVQFSGGVVQSLSFVVSVENLQFCGNSAYQAYFFSKTNRCIYVFTGANILNQLQLVDKISEIYAYKYNQSTQSIILLTDMGIIVSSNLGMYLIEDFTPDDVFFYDKGVVFVSDSELTYLQYYEADGFDKQNIELETCFYGVSNETVSVNDCLYIRLFSEEHEEGEIKISATTLANTGRKTEETTFKITSNDWDKMTHSLYLRYQPKTQRGLGVSFSINSPFKIASMSVGTQADAILIDKVSKGAINAPAIKSSNVAW
jgi:hypothetical protein